MGMVSQHYEELLDEFINICLPERSVISEDDYEEARCQLDEKLISGIEPADFDKAIDLLERKHGGPRALPEVLRYGLSMAPEEMDQGEKWWGEVVHEAYKKIVCKGFVEDDRLSTKIPITVGSDTGYHPITHNYGSTHVSRASPNFNVAELTSILMAYGNMARGLLGEQELPLEFPDEGGTMSINRELLRYLIRGKYIQNPPLGLIDFLVNMPVRQIQSTLSAFEPRLAEDPKFRAAFQDAIGRHASAMEDAVRILRTFQNRIG